LLIIIVDQTTGKRESDGCGLTSIVSSFGSGGVVSLGRVIFLMLLVTALIDKLMPPV
jgi:hypothetical protein